MKQVTGNNNNIHNKEISIQILLDGFSLFEHSSHNNAIHAKLQVNNIMHLHQTLVNFQPTAIHTLHLSQNPIIVPTEIVTNANNYIKLLPNQTLIKEQIDNINIFFNASTDVYNIIQNSALYTTHNHPLALTIKNAQKNTLTITQQHNCTCFVLTSTIALLEAFTAHNATEQDILYYIKKLMPCNNISIITDNPQTTRLVAKYYKLQNAIVTASPFSTLL